MGNLSGDLTSPFIPYATGLHALANSPLRRDADGATLFGSYRSEVDAPQNWSKTSGGASSVAPRDIYFFVSEGTVAAPTDVQDGDYLGGFNWFGYVGAGYWGCAAIEILVDGSVSGPHNLASRMNFLISDDAGNPVTALGMRWAGGAVLDLDMTFNKATRKKYHTVAIASGLIHIDAPVGNFFRVDLSAAAMLAAPTNSQEGDTFQLRTKQTAGGGHALTFDTVFRFPDGIAPTIATTLDGTVDYYDFQYNEDSETWDYAGGAPNLQVPE